MHVLYYSIQLLYRCAACTTRLLKRILSSSIIALYCKIQMFFESCSVKRVPISTIFSTYSKESFLGGAPYLISATPLLYSNVRRKKLRQHSDCYEMRYCTVLYSLKSVAHTSTVLLFISTRTSCSQQCKPRLCCLLYLRVKVVEYGQLGSDWLGCRLTRTQCSSISASGVFPRLWCPSSSGLFSIHSLNASATISAGHQFLQARAATNAIYTTGI